MYSIVMVAAMTAAPAQPAYGPHPQAECSGIFVGGDWEGGGWVWWGPYYAAFGGYAPWTIPGAPVLYGSGPGDYVPSPTLAVPPPVAPAGPTGIPDRAKPEPGKGPDAPGGESIPKKLGRLGAQPAAGASLAMARSPVTVTLSANCELFVAGVTMTVNAGTHSFRTPELVQGQACAYEFRARFDRPDGKSEIVTKKVTFRAGEPVVVDFAGPMAERSVAAK